MLFYMLKTNNTEIVNIFVKIKIFFTEYFIYKSKFFICFLFIFLSTEKSALLTEINKVIILNNYNFL